MSRQCTSQDSCFCCHIPSPSDYLEFSRSRGRMTMQTVHFDNNMSSLSRYRFGSYSEIMLSMSSTSPSTPSLVNKSMWWWGLFLACNYSSLSIPKHLFSKVSFWVVEQIFHEATGELIEGPSGDVWPISNPQLIWSCTKYYSHVFWTSRLMQPGLCDYASIVIVNNEGECLLGTIFCTSSRSSFQYGGELTKLSGRRGQSTWNVSLSSREVHYRSLSWIIHCICSNSRISSWRSSILVAVRSSHCCNSRPESSIMFSVHSHR